MSSLMIKFYNALNKYCHAANTVPLIANSVKQHFRQG